MTGTLEAGRIGPTGLRSTATLIRCGRIRPWSISMAGEAADWGHDAFPRRHAGPPHPRTTERSGRPGPAGAVPPSGRASGETVYECPQPTPMVLVLNVHYSRASDMVRPDYLVTDPSIPIAQFRDAFGNWCTRLVAPRGRVKFTADGVVRDAGAPDPVVAIAHATPVQDLPEETLPFLLGSRYCETDRLLGRRRGRCSDTAPHRLGAGAGDLRFRPHARHVRLRAARVRPSRRGRSSASGPASAATSRTWRSRSAGA